MSCKKIKFGDVNVWLCNCTEESWIRSLTLECELRQRQEELELDIERELELNPIVKEEPSEVFDFIPDYDFYNNFTFYDQILSRERITNDDINQEDCDFVDFQDD